MFTSSLKASSHITGSSSSGGGGGSSSWHLVQQIYPAA